LVRCCSQFLSGSRGIGAVSLAHVLANSNSRYKWSPLKTRKIGKFRYESQYINHTDMYNPQSTIPHLRRASDFRGEDCREKREKWVLIAVQSRSNLYSSIARFFRNNHVPNISHHSMLTGFKTSQQYRGYAFDVVKRYKSMSIQSRIPMVNFDPESPQRLFCPYLHRSIVSSICPKKNASTGGYSTACNSSRLAIL